MTIDRRKNATNRIVITGSMVTEILQYIFVLLVIVYGQTVWIRLNYSGNIYTILYIGLIAIAAVLILLQRKINTRACFTSLMLAIFIAIYYIFSGYGLSLVLRIGILLFLLVIYLWTLIDRGKVINFVKKYSDIVIILTAISLVLYVFGSLLHLLPSTTVSYFWAGRETSCHTYFYLLFETQVDSVFGMTFVRNCSVFCEAPSYAVALSISLFIELFTREKLSRARLIILFLGVITSFSTKAILIAGIILALKLFQFVVINKQGGENARLLKSITPVVIIIILFALVVVLGQKMDTSSFVDRMDNLYTSMLAFSKHPLFGVGLGNEDAVSQYTRLSLQWKGFSMGATLLLAEGGLYMTVFYIASFVRAFRANKNKWLVCSVGIVFFAILFSSNIAFYPSIIFVLALGFASHRKASYKEPATQTQQENESVRLDVKAT